MYIDRKQFEEWMQRIMDRLESIDKKCTALSVPASAVLPEGEKMLDNYDLCNLLNVSKRTLQRYRTSGELPYQMIYHKTFYKESDVLQFIEKHFSTFRKMKKE